MKQIFKKLKKYSLTAFLPVLTAIFLMSGCVSVQQSPGITSSPSLTSDLHLVEDASEGATMAPASDLSEAEDASTAEAMQAEEAETEETAEVTEAAEVIGEAEPEEAQAVTETAGQAATEAAEVDEGSKSDDTAQVTQAAEPATAKAAQSSEGSKSSRQLDPDGTYTSKEDVALYIYTYGRLPGNFITKKKARALGWEGGKLEPYAPGMCIGGDYYGNYEGTLPDGPTYHECDIDTLGRKRGAKRIIYSDDGHIYYTEDHYESFDLLYENGANQKRKKK